MVDPREAVPSEARWYICEDCGCGGWDAEEVDHEFGPHAVDGPYRFRTVRYVLAAAGAVGAVDQGREDRWHGATVRRVEGEDYVLLSDYSREWHAVEVQARRADATVAREAALRAENERLQQLVNQHESAWEAGHQAGRRMRRGGEAALREALQKEYTNGGIKDESFLRLSALAAAGAPEECPNPYCDGTGWCAPRNEGQALTICRVGPHPAAGAPGDQRRTCERCGGSGEVWGRGSMPGRKVRCPNCQGSGSLPLEKEDR